jgi:excisionase family DNA binding protein
MAIPDQNLGRLKEDFGRIALSIREASRKTGLSRATLYRCLKDGRLTSIKVGARRLIRPDALDALLSGGAAK